MTLNQTTNITNLQNFRAAQNSLITVENWSKPILNSFFKMLIKWDIRTRVNPRFHGSIASNLSFHSVRSRFQTANYLSFYEHFMKLGRNFSNSKSSHQKRKMCGKKTNFRVGFFKFEKKKTTCPEELFTK